MFRGPLTVLLLRIGVVAGLYTALRVLFWLYNTELFPAPPAEAFIGGLRFDASAIAWLELPWVLLVLIHPKPPRWAARVQFGLFFVINALALFFNCVDMGYYAFSLKRSTADFLQIITTGDDTANLAPAFLRDYWHLLLIYLASLAVLVWSYPRIGRIQREDTKRWSWRIGWRSITIALLALSTRGGTQLIPLQALDAAKYGGAMYMPLVLNTPFTILTTLGKPILVERSYMAETEADALWPVIQSVGRSLDDSAGTALRPDQPNVVVIILESFSALYSARLSGGDGYMPFLDSLMEQSLTYTNAYANGRRSIDGIPGILASMPQWMDEAFITSPYASIPFTSLGNVLGPMGYRTSFYHGGRNGTMGFDGFAKSAGFDRYVGLNEYGTDSPDFDGHWGVRDQPFLQFYAHELNKEKEPFLSTIFTLSSHHPYELPKADAEHFAGGTQPIHPTLRYTDDALRRFFATARNMPWYASTLFVITSDHTADIQRNGSQGNKPIDYWIPLLYHAPWLKSEFNDRVTQHIDIQPTVLSMIGHERPFFSFGHNSLEPVHPPVAIWSNNGLYTISNANQQVQFNGEEILAVIPIDADVTAEPAETGALERYLKAAIQQYNHHLINAELTAKPTVP